LDPSAWLEEISTTGTAETLARSNMARELFKFAADVVDEFHRLKQNQQCVFRVSVWTAKYVYNGRCRYDLNAGKSYLLGSEVPKVQKRFWQWR